MDPTLTAHASWTVPADQSRPSASAPPQHRISVILVRDLPTLSSFVPAWEELAANALEPNVFYEHWMLLPALKAYGAGKDISVALVLMRDQRNPAALEKLAGLFPLQMISRFKNLNVSAVSLWQHIHCYICTPLVRADCASECMSGVFHWLRSGAARASLMELRCISGDGPFQKLLIDLSNDLGLLNWITDIYTRGLWRDAQGPAGGPASAISGDLRRRLRRKEKRMGERGQLKHVVMQPQDNVRRWIEEFLALEASGWKGQQGSALACTETGRRYFTEIAAAAFRRGRLLMLGLDFDGRPIARRCAFVAGEGSFAFKTTYDEAFASYSPGAMLEMDSLEQLHALPGVRWMDSCAATNNALVNRISNDRKTIQSLAVGGGALGELVISGLPLLRWTNRRVLKRNSADTPTEPSH